TSESISRHRGRVIRRGVTVVLLGLLVAGCSGGRRLDFETRAVAPGSTEVAASQTPAVEGGVLASGERAAGGGTASRQLPGGRPSAARTGPAAPPGGGVVRLGIVLPLQGGQRDFG